MKTVKIMKVINTGTKLFPNGHRILHLNENNRWERYTGRHFTNMAEVHTWLKSWELEHPEQELTVKWPPKYRPPYQF